MKKLLITLVVALGSTLAGCADPPPPAAPPPAPAPAAAPITIGGITVPCFTAGSQCAMLNGVTVNNGNCCSGSCQAGVCR